jgi:hypothetical protein
MSTTSDVIFDGGHNVNTINFTYSGNYCITGRKDLSVAVSPNNAKKITVTVTGDRSGSTDCVDSFRQQFGGNTVNTIHTRGGDARPEELNFWIAGTLTINGDEESKYLVVLAQGSHRRFNNWFIGSRSITAETDNKAGVITLGGKHPKYRITTDDSNIFKVDQLS